MGYRRPFRAILSTIIDDWHAIPSSDLRAAQSLMADIQLFKKMASPAPKSPEQSEKSKKYDRQLRFMILIVINVFLITQTYGRKHYILSNKNR